MACTRCGKYNEGYEKDGSLIHICAACKLVEGYGPEARVALLTWLALNPAAHVAMDILLDGRPMPLKGQASA